MTTEYRIDEADVSESELAAKDLEQELNTKCEKCGGKVVESIISNDAIAYCKNCGHLQG